MSGEIESEYDHDILMLISTAQKIRDGEEKASSIDPNIKDKSKNWAYLPSLVQARGLISTDFL